MIKPNKKDWTFTELQYHAKGVLEGLGLGIILSFNVGCLIYYYYFLSK